MTRTPGVDTFALFRLSIQRYATYRSLRLVLYLLLGLGGTIPVSQHKAALLHAVLELFPRIHLKGHLFTEAIRLVIDILLNLIQQRCHMLLDAGKLRLTLLQRVATHHLNGAVGYITRAQHKANRHTLQLIVGELKARTFVVGS